MTRHADFVHLENALRDGTGKVTVGRPVPYTVSADLNASLAMEAAGRAAVATGDREARLYRNGDPHPVITITVTADDEQVLLRAGATAH
jgi:hypothetical protein